MAARQDSRLHSGGSMTRRLFVFTPFPFSVVARRIGLWMSFGAAFQVSMSGTKGPAKIC